MMLGITNSELYIIRDALSSREPDSVQDSLMIVEAILDKNIEVIPAHSSKDILEFLDEAEDFFDLDLLQYEEEVGIHEFI